MKKKDLGSIPGMGVGGMGTIFYREIYSYHVSLQFFNHKTPAALLDKN